MDWTLFRWVNGRAGDHSLLDHLGRFAATDMQFVIVGTLIAGWLVAVGMRVWRERRVPRGLTNVVLVTGAALALGLLADQIVGHMWFRDRPYDTHANVHVLEPRSTDASFPSDHATAGFALSFGVMTALPVLGALLVVETVLMSLGRVFVGLHYPGDVLGSLGVALVATLVAVLIVRRVSPLVDWLVAGVNARIESRGWALRLE